MVNTEPSPKYVSLAEAAKYAGCSQRFLRRRIAAGDLASSLVGGRRFVTLAAIDEMMESTSQPAAKQGARDSPHRADDARWGGGTDRVEFRKGARTKPGRAIESSSKEQCRRAQVASVIQT